MDAYTERNEILKALGFRDYKMYLRSPLWKEIRQRKISINPECYGCGRGDSGIILQVHHSEYTLLNLSGKSLDGLFTVCSRCHHFAEVTIDGYKRNPEEATAILELIRIAYHN